MQSAKGRRTRSKASLRKLGQVPLESVAPIDYVAQIKAESHRGAVILLATYIEEALAERLRSVLLTHDPSLEEKLFGTNGILGTFAAKTTMMVALGLISPLVSDLIDHVRHMRNAAAHLSATVSFSAPELRDAVLALVDDDSQQMVSDASADELRDVFALCSMLIQLLVTGPIDRPHRDSSIRNTLRRVHSGIEASGAIPFSKTYFRDPNTVSLKARD